MPSATCHDEGSGFFEWTGGPAPEYPCKPLGALGHFLLDCMRRHAERHAESHGAARPAEIDGPSGSTRTWPEVLGESVRAALGWRSLGLTVADTAVFYTRNGHNNSAAVLGAFLEGITVTAVVPYAKEDEARLLLSRLTTTYKAIVCDVENLEAVRRLAPRGVVVVVTAEHSDVEGVMSVPNLLHRAGASDGVDVNSYEAPDVADPRTHKALVVSSSGTSGLPKGVACTNYGLLLNALLDGWGVLADDVVLVTSPVSWITGVMYTIIPVIRGATRVLYSFTNEGECLDMIRKYKVSQVFLAPARIFLLTGLVKNLRQKGVDVDLSHWRIAMAGGAPMTAELQSTCADVLGTCIPQCYGCTETLLAMSDAVAPPATPGTALGAHPTPTPGSAGKLVPGIRARLVDVLTGEDIRVTNAVGELLIKTPCYMAGYVADPENTADAVDAHGWYRTGDLVQVSDDGHVFIVDRIKELLKCMGTQMTPAEIEDVLMKHPAVRHACVVGHKHEVAGDIPYAFVVLFPGKKASEQELQQLVRARLCDGKQLRGGIIFVDEIPLSTNGKVDRKLLRTRLSKLPPVSDELLGLTHKV